MPEQRSWWGSFVDMARRRRRGRRRDGHTRRSLLGMASKREGRIQPSVTSQPPRHTARTGRPKEEGGGGGEGGVFLLASARELRHDETRRRRQARLRRRLLIMLMQYWLTTCSALFCPLLLACLYGCKSVFFFGLDYPYYGTIISLKIIYISII